MAILAGAGAAYLIGSYANHAGTTTYVDSTTFTRITCMTTYPGQPLGVSLRVVNATTLGPVVGAAVTATAPISGVCGDSNPIAVSVQFTTNSTEWYSLPFINHGTYQIGVTYLGHSYNLTMPLGLSVYNCATLYVPSGQTDITTTGSARTPCQSAVPTTMTTAVSTTSEVCTVTADPAGFFLHLMTDSVGAPVAGVQVKVIPMIECVGNPTPAISMEATYITNGTGWITVTSYPGGQEYYLPYDFQYSGRGYNVTADWRPEQGTFTTVGLPSGNFTPVYLIPKSCNGTCTF